MVDKLKRTGSSNTVQVFYILIVIFLKLCQDVNS